MTGATGSEAIARSPSGTARCPNDIDIALVMDVVRQMARLKGKKLPIKEPRVFQDVFLKSVENHGRLYEPGMIAFYNLQSGDLFHVVALGPKMLLKGKLPLLPHTSKNREKLREIFRKAEAFEKEAGKKASQEGHDESGH